MTEVAVRAVHVRDLNWKHIGGGEYRRPDGQLYEFSPTTEHVLFFRAGDEASIRAHKKGLL